MCRAKKPGLLATRAIAKIAVAGATVDSVSVYLGPERRANPRGRIATQAVIWRDRYSVVLCTVRDMSSAGAGLLLPDSVSPLPPEFALTFDRATRRCVLVWRQISRAGVKFEPI
jgi:hypothetical protein